MKIHLHTLVQGICLVFTCCSAARVLPVWPRTTPLPTPPTVPPICIGVNFTHSAGTVGVEKLFRLPQMQIWYSPCRWPDRGRHAIPWDRSFTFKAVKGERVSVLANWPGRNEPGWIFMLSPEEDMAISCTGTSVLDGRCTYSTITTTAAPTTAAPTECVFLNVVNAALYDLVIAYSPCGSPRWVIKGSPITRRHSARYHISKGTSVSAQMYDPEMQVMHATGRIMIDADTKMTCKREFTLLTKTVKLQCAT